MNIIKIKNKNGTSDKSPPRGYSSWLDFWEKNKMKKASSCEVVGCKNDAKVGGHVIISGEGNKEYIIPLCTSCNNKPDGEEFKAWSFDLVSVR